MKISLTRILETAKILSTDVGQQIPDFFQYMSEFVEQTVRSLRNGLNFKDNFDCEYKIISLKQGVAQQISATRTVTEVRFTRVNSQSFIFDKFGWYYDDNGNLTIKVYFDPAPALPTDTIDVTINLIF